MIEHMEPSRPIERAELAASLGALRALESSLARACSLLDREARPTEILGAPGLSLDREARTAMEGI